MIDTKKLRELAVAAIEPCTVGDHRRFSDAANPQAIIELIDRLERAEARAEFGTPGEREIREVIEQWKYSWMDVKGTDEQDRKNYFNRAFGVDANMIWSLAKRLAKKFEVTHE